MQPSSLSCDFSVTGLPHVVEDIITHIKYQIHQPYLTITSLPTDQGLFIFRQQSKHSGRCLYAYHRSPFQPLRYGLVVLILWIYIALSVNRRCPVKRRLKNDIIVLSYTTGAFYEKVNYRNSWLWSVYVYAGSYTLLLGMLKDQRLHIWFAVNLYKSR
jgi:hypothetical protein